MNCDLLPCQQGWFSPGSSGFHPENHPCCMVPDILFCILIYMYVFIYITKPTSNVKYCNPPTPPVSQQYGWFSPGNSGFHPLDPKHTAL